MRLTDDIIQQFEINLLEKKNILGEGSFGIIASVVIPNSSTSSGTNKPLDDNEQSKQGKSYAVKKFIKYNYSVFNEVNAVHKIPQHPNLVTALASSMSPLIRDLYILLEKCDVSLQSYILKHYKGVGVTCAETRRSWTGQILQGLDFLYKHGFVHNDLSPANVLLTFPNAGHDENNQADREAIIKLTDYGLSYGRLLPNPLPHLISFVVQPPELFKVDISHRFDLVKIDSWSVGLIHYFVTFGQFLINFDHCSREPKDLEDNYLLGVILCGNPTEQLIRSFALFDDYVAVYQKHINKIVHPNHLEVLSGDPTMRFGNVFDFYKLVSLANASVNDPTNDGNSPIDDRTADILFINRLVCWDLDYRIRSQDLLDFYQYSFVLVQDDAHSTSNRPNLGNASAPFPQGVGNTEAAEQRQTIVNIGAFIPRTSKLIKVIIAEPILPVYVTYSNLYFLKTSNYFHSNHVSTSCVQLSHCTQDWHSQTVAMHGIFLSFKTMYVLSLMHKIWKNATPVAKESLKIILNKLFAGDYDILKDFHNKFDSVGPMILYFYYHYDSVNRRDKHALTQIIKLFATYFSGNLDFTDPLEMFMLQIDEIGLRLDTLQSSLLVSATIVHLSQREPASQEHNSTNSLRERCTVIADSNEQQQEHAQRIQENLIDFIYYYAILLGSIFCSFFDKGDIVKVCMTLARQCLTDTDLENLRLYEKLVDIERSCSASAPANLPNVYGRVTDSLTIDQTAVLHYLLFVYGSNRDVFGQMPEHVVGYLDDLIIRMNEM